jgi:DNA-directed RNA polymerase subunit RPC12/RpoP
MKQVKISIHFNLYVECPHCDEVFDLLAMDDNDEGFWTGKFRDWINNEKDAEILTEDVQCPHCDNRVDLKDMEY